MAFKDFALQLLGGIFDKFLADSDKKINILGATSGDTGSAAIEAFKNKTNLNLFVLHPEGKISEFQRKQMTTVKSNNIFNSCGNELESTKEELNDYLFLLANKVPDKSKGLNLPSVRQKDPLRQ